MKITLPKTPNNLASAFTGLSYFEILKLSKNPDKLTPKQKIYWKYGKTALKMGRPLDSCVIFMAGASGSGKSSTINVLFDDPNLCLTSSLQSETGSPVMFRKSVCVTGEYPPVSGYLSVVDVPGTFDTNPDIEADNLASVQKFQKTMLELQRRKPWGVLKVRWDVYPNLILFTMKATDNRILGKDSFLAKSLKALDSTGLLDRRNPNIIIVLTHAMSLPSISKEKFEAKLNEKIQAVREVVWDILNIPEVAVVPVENCGEDYCEKFGDFYSLPNGDLSHYNLYKVMVQLFGRNQDSIGTLFAGWYFGMKCLDKIIPPVEVRPEEKVDEVDIKEAEEVLEKLKISVDRPESCIVPEFNFQSLGYGYCPVREEIRPISILHSGEKIKQKIVTVDGSKFSVPQCVKVFVTNSSCFKQASFLDKEEYQRHMQASYGIEADMELIVKTGSMGRWVNSLTKSSESSVMSLRHEIQVATFKVENPDELEVNPKLTKHLNELPNTFCDSNAKEFQRFFSKWGTHFVIEQVVGGALQLDYTLERASVTKESLQEIESSLSAVFIEIGGMSTAGIGIRADYKCGGGRSRKVDVSDVHLRIDGGDPPKLVSVETVNSEELRRWSKTVAQNPTELRRSMKLYPYYNFLKCGQRYDSLREATSQYLKDTLVSKIVGAINMVRTRDQISDSTVQNVKDDVDSNCFPKGTLIYVEDGQSVSVEELRRNLQISTVSLEGGSMRSWKLGKPTATSFCTFLDRKDNNLVEYLVLHASSKNELVVSPGHMIFEYCPGKAVVKSKQAKHFKAGDMVVYRAETGAPEVVTVERISRRMDVGAYSPLTTSGTFFANGFLVSSYANINNFAIAEAALFPLKTWGMLKGMKKSNKKTEIAIQNPGDIPAQGLHPYAKFLISLRKLATSVGCTNKK